jgi:hypothetical protein
VARGLKQFVVPEVFMDTIKPLFTATATATGGRNGHTQASDGSVSADLSVPKAMGGPGGLERQRLSIFLPRAMPPVSAERSISSASNTRRMPAKRGSLPTCRSDRAMLAASGWR